MNNKGPYTFRHRVEKVASNITVSAIGGKLKPLVVPAPIETPTTSIPESTPTPTPTLTNTETETITPGMTPTPTETPTATETATETPTATETATETPTATETATETITPGTFLYSLAGPDNEDALRQINIFTSGDPDTIYYNDYDGVSSTYTSMIVYVNSVAKANVGFTTDRLGSQFGYSVSGSTPQATGTFTSGDVFLTI